MTFYLVVSQDTHGTKRLIDGYGENLSEKEAVAVIGLIESRQNKPHKMDYFKIPYEPGNKNLVITREHILL